MKWSMNELPGALILLVPAFFASCASATRPTPQPLVHFAPGLGMTEPRPQGECAAHGPAYPEQAAREGISGPVIVDLTVDESGHAKSIVPAAESAPALLEAVQRWATACTFAPGTLQGRPVPMFVRKIYRLHPGRVIDPGEGPAIEVRDGDRIERPEPVGCVPAAPPRLGIEGRLLVSYVVHRNGYADSIRFGPDAEPALEKLASAWLGSCTFRPARMADGSLVAARVEEQIYAFDDPVVRVWTTDPEGDVHLLANGPVTRPVAVACDGPRPAVPEETRQTGTAGTVIMRYVVRADGRVADIVPLNRHASPPLVDSVRKWLLSCRFQPAKNPSGELTDLKVVQPFLFKLR